MTSVLCFFGMFSHPERFKRKLNLSNFGAGDGNRTHVISLEGWSSTIELHPHAPLVSVWTVLYHTHIFFYCQEIFLLTFILFLFICKNMMKKYLISTLFLCLVGCGLEQYPAGDLPTQTRLNAIQTGDSKEKVLRVLGTPASENPPMENGKSFLVYAQNLKVSRAFLEPEETKRDVYVYYFNESDMLSQIQHLTLADAKNIPYDSEQTEVGGKEMSLFEQLVNNFGRYNTGSSDSSVRR